MLRILRAFAWMRWRVLLNSLERTAARDTLQRLSLAVEQLGPLLAAALFIPSAAALAAIAGYGVATSGARPVLPFELLRFVLLAAVALSVAGPLLLPATERTNAVRLLLLPIPRPVLYAAQAASALADPWILLAIPMVIVFPLGLVAGGAGAAALVSLLAGLVLIAVLVGLSSLSTLVLHLVMRDRRRGELLALGFVVVLPLVTILPGLLLEDEDRRERVAERTEPRGIETVPSWVWTAGKAAFGLLPSELFRQAVRQSAGGGGTGALAPLALLTLTGLALHGLGLAASSRALDSPASSGPRRAAGRFAGRTPRVPGLSTGASIVAVNQIRLAIRTPRGRSILISPLLIFAVVLVVMHNAGGGAALGFMRLASGLGLATFGAAVCLLALMPFAMNQFAIDRAGLTLQFLSPLSDRDILIGKAVGNGIAAGVPALLCFAGALALFPGGHAGLWLSVPLGFLATYLTAAPAAAALSATFPRAVDLNSIGSRSNAHGLAGMLGLLAVAAASVPPLVIVVAARGSGNTALAPLLLLVWCGVCLVLCRVLLSAAARLFHRRRENLALVV